jgi:hypothetical protein
MSIKEQETNMDTTENEGMNMITVSAICKRCGKTFAKDLPRELVAACEEAGAQGFTGTCPRCAAADPVFSALHGQL